MANDTILSYAQCTQAVWYLKQWPGTPYLWGGDDFSGFDCSGLILEVLQSVGVLPHGIDMTAHSLYLRFKKNPAKPGPGHLVFWFRDGRAIHVEMMVNDMFTIGASGGGHKVKSIKDAIKYNAFVKMRPLEYRGANYKIVDPFKEDE